MAALKSTEAEAPKPVRQRLLDVAEGLFAEHGWNAVSIRTIAAAADVSLAALNYHFGLKENLLAEIFALRAKPIADARMRLLDEIEASGTATLESVLEAFLRPALATGTDNPSGGAMFGKLRARLATEPEAVSRRILSEAFDDSSRRYIAALQTLLPELSPAELAWRFHFLLGTMVYTMADAGRIRSLTDGTCDPGDTEAALRHIIPFMAAGFRSPPPPLKPTRRRKPKA